MERFVPGNPLEATRSLSADAAQRMQHTLARIHAVQIVRDLRAQHALCGWMSGGTFDLDRAAVLDRDFKRAGVGAIVRARRPHDLAGERCGRVPIERHRYIVRAPLEPAAANYSMTRSIRACS